MTDLEFAVELATRAHEGQKDRAGVPYIEHPKAVAAMVNTDEEKTVAMLHDVVEDTDVTMESLRALFPNSPDIMDAVELLTHLESVEYMEYVAAIKDNQLAKTVKLADLAHNSDRSRLKGEPTDKDEERFRKYAAATALLMDDDRRKDSAM